MTLIFLVSKGKKITEKFGSKASPFKGIKKGILSNFKLLASARGTDN
ncbi:MAG: hypothetical protein F6K15_13555 [Okeania sp. SIO2B3]|nr:hypothetical protein [Okeania sp. SIO2B3]